MFSCGTTDLEACAKKQGRQDKAVTHRTLAAETKQGITGRRDRKAADHGAQVDRVVRTRVAQEAEAQVVQVAEAQVVQVAVAQAARQASEARVVQAAGARAARMARQASG